MISNMYSYALALPLLLANTVLASSLRPAPIPDIARRQDVDPTELYPAYNFSVPVDHFQNDSRYEPHSNETFDLRYYFDASYYQPGGPVIILQGGETSVTGRLPYLQHGIVQQLAQATGGIGVILEHRYYGTSFPVSNLSTENFRFLTTQQALADQAYFQENIVFPGMENMNLTAPGTAHIVYGGSYAGAFVSLLRKIYPEATWAAISSSGVTEAYYDFWQYYEPVREYGPPECIDTHVKLIDVLDTILMGDNNDTIAQLQEAFNASAISNTSDFAYSLGNGIGGWQGRNWDPAVNSPAFDEYCGNITANSTISSDMNTTQFASFISEAGWSNESSTLAPAMANFASWYMTYNEEIGCQETLNDCYGYSNASNSIYTDRSVENYNALSWPYQYCTQWAYLQSGSSVPQDRKPLISRLVSLDWNMLVCNYGFNISSPPATEEINQYGGYNFTFPRLATIGGQTDPWRLVSPLAEQPLEGSNETTTIVNNTSTASEPIVVIEGAVHHWDENGLFANETTPDLPPPPVREAQAIIVQAAQVWMTEWRQYCVENPGVCNNL